MVPRILVIRGGAIGDFILTLPALALLREAFPQAHIEILGYPHIASLAAPRHYANALRNIEYASLAGFFNPRSELDPELSEYFASFQQVISYLYDPDGHFEFNLRRAGVKNLITGSPKIKDHTHAAAQLAAPLAQLALFLEDTTARFFPTRDDLEDASRLIGTLPPPYVAIHPGSGSPQKNWPISEWTSLADDILSHPSNLSLLIIGGESDEAALAPLHPIANNPRVRFLLHHPLPILGAVLSRCRLFIGHDSGISHLAAAAGCPSLLLFGPTDPAVWAPAGSHVHVIRATAPDDMESISRNQVWQTAQSLLGLS